MRRIARVRADVESRTAAGRSRPGLQSIGHALTRPPSSTTSAMNATAHATAQRIALFG